MEHLALYRKYRPKTFDEVIGQEHIIKTLKNQVDKGQISHAYLFNGTRGTGKTSTAKIFAKAINCLNPKNGSPCLKCEVCKALDDPSSLDILEIDAASNNRVDEIRDLKEKIKYPPVNGKYKVYIIDEVHMLTDSAFNALLKTLEEPPSHAVFVLATTEVHKLPATILSRVMRFDFKLVSVDDLIKLLEKIFKEENIKADKESLRAMAVAGEGSVRDTLSVADVCASYSGNNITYNDVLNALGTTTKSVLLGITHAIINKNTKNLLIEINKIASEGKNLSVLAKDLTVHFRNLLLIKSVKNANDILGLPEEIFEEMKNQAEKESVGNLLFYMQKLSAVEGELRYSANERLLLETATLSCMMENASTVEGLEKRIEELEKKSKNVKIENSNDLQKNEVKTAKNVEKSVKNSEKHENMPENEQKTPKNDEIEHPNKYANISVNQLWGKVLIELRENNQPVLYTVCGEVEPVKIDGNIFKLQVSDETVYGKLVKDENLNALQKLLQKLDVDVRIEVTYLKKEVERTKNETEELLKQKFGDKLNII
ncbi:MAG: DNA polymerase III subunit gamma/tau [Spirochaetales bacterium]